MMLPHLSVSQEEKDLALTLTVASLDFWSLMRMLLHGSRFWEGVVAEKHIYLVLYESFSKICYLTNTKTPEQAEANKNQSLWYGKIPKLMPLVSLDRQLHYQSITGKLDDFRNRQNWEYIARIRTRAGHYSNIRTYIADMQTINIDDTLIRMGEWSMLLKEIRDFVITNHFYNQATTSITLKK